MKDLAEKSQSRYTNLRFLGRINEESKYQLMQQCHILVFPSIDDNFPYTVAESQLRGLFVISSNIPGISDIIIPNVTGALVKPLDTLEYVKAIEEQFELFSMNRNDFENRRVEISTKGKRFCSDKVLPKLHNMLLEFNESEASK